MQLKRYYYFLLLVALLVSSKSFSQVSNEVGLFMGPAAFQSDYGEDKNFRNIRGNVGYVIGIVHYLNMAMNADCDCFNRYTYFNDHFEIKNELTYTFSRLDHFGQYVGPDRTSLTADQLRAMHGTVNNLGLGTNLEYYPIPIREFLSGNYLFVPYGALGIQANLFMPQNYSDLGSIVTQEQAVLPEKYQNGQLTNDAGIAVSFSADLGLRFKITRDSDATISMRFKYYMSDWVDGMNPDSKKYPENQRNDSAVWLTLGYIIYL